MPIGSGGTGVVWRGRDRRVGRDVAVKVVDVRLGPAARDRFERETRALARLAGTQGVVPVHAVGVGEDGLAWIICGLMEGGSLADRLVQGPLDVGDVISVGRSAADALAAARSLDVVHGDVTPSNVLFDADGTALLSDFGLASIGDPSPTVDTALTPAFAAPELRDGGPRTWASDVYGLGATLWAAACGSPPDHAGSPPPPDMPRGLDRVLVPCTAPDPSRRPDVRAVGRELEDLASRRRRTEKRSRGRFAFRRHGDG